MFFYICTFKVPPIGTWDLDHVLKYVASVQIFNNEQQCTAQLAILISLALRRLYHVPSQLLDCNLEGRLNNALGQPSVMWLQHAVDLPDKQGGKKKLEAKSL